MLNIGIRCVFITGLTVWNGEVIFGIEFILLTFMKLPRRNPKAGECLPWVFHSSFRLLVCHSLSLLLCLMTKGAMDFHNTDIFSALSCRRKCTLITSGGRGPGKDSHIYGECLNWNIALPVLRTRTLWTNVLVSSLNMQVTLAINHTSHLVIVYVNTDCSQNSQTFDLKRVYFSESWWQPSWLQLAFLALTATVWC